jgi:hypothetical protein
MLLTMILLVSFFGAMAGCTARNGSLIVPRPHFQRVWSNDRGGICLDRRDTASLLHYLETLEAAL